MKHIHDDGIDRRGFLDCMAWAGTALLISLEGGVARGQTLASNADTSVDFAQISDSHIGFNKAANTDVAGTLQVAVDRINALASPPAFVLHTGDISQSAKPEEFDTAQQILKGIKGEVFYVPGEHDVVKDRGKPYLERFGKKTQGDGWFRFDHQSAHFVGLVNVMNFQDGLGVLGRDQLDWLKEDLASITPSTPVVIFAHMPLWTVYKEWGWGTADGMEALGYLKRFGSVTVLNGHIHQSMRKVEGSMIFHTACSTAFPQPKPGSAPAAGPMAVPTEQLRSVLGMTEIKSVRGSNALAVIDHTL